MKKYCFVYIDNINRMPYIKKYIKAAKFEYDIIYWNRSGMEEEIGANNYYQMRAGSGKGLVSRIIGKAIGYIRFGHFASKILKKNNYAGVFVFTPNVGMLCYGVLRDKYKYKYILDIRDYWKENEKWLQFIEKKLVKYSYANIISSKAYTKFLPKAEYVLTHNSQEISDEVIKIFKRTRKNGNKIVLSCIGGIKYADYDKKVLAYFANDHRFEIRYMGRGYEVLDEYCKKMSIGNVKIEGIFPMEETMQKYEGTDMILNMYGNHNPKLDYALSNKLYFAAQLGLPIVVCKDTYMAEVSEKYGFGFALDLEDEKDKERLYEYHKKLQFDSLDAECDKFMENIKKDEAIFNNVVKEFVNIE